jgi:hypothetical protein
MPGGRFRGTGFGFVRRPSWAVRNLRNFSTAREIGSLYVAWRRKPHDLGDELQHREVLDAAPPAGGRYRRFR